MKIDTYTFTATAAAKSLQLCPTLYDPMDCSPPGSSAHWIFQARVLEWGAIAFSDIHLYVYLNLNLNFHISSQIFIVNSVIYRVQKYISGVSLLFNYSVFCTVLLK